MEDNESVVKQQDEIMIYANSSGGITIHSVSPYHNGTIISFGLIHANDVISAIRRAVIEAQEDEA